MISTEILNKIAICLVEPMYAGNIGSVARAMKNMNFSRLIIVNGADPDCEEAKKMASGHYDIIENAQHFDTLEEAIAPFNIVAGTTRRTGKSRRPTHFSKTFPDFLFPLLDDNEAVILFGREQHGLSTEELDRCQYHVLIPSNDTFGSLNLSQAVMVICYELFQATLDLPESPGHGRKLAPSQSLENMYAHLRSVMLEVGFCDPKNPEWMIRALRNIFGRSGLDERDIRIIRGIFSDVDWYIDHCIEVGKRDGYKEEK